MTRLLVSVRSAVEARTALDGGADIIDIKEPSHGSLGRANDRTIQEIIGVVKGRRLVSVALGEWQDRPALPHFDGWWLAKVGFADNRDNHEVLSSEFTLPGS